MPKPGRFIMLRKVFEISKPVLSAVLILAFLHFSGLLGSASFVAQTVLLKTGINNARTTAFKKPTDFDYNFYIKDLGPDRQGLASIPAGLAGNNGERIRFDRYKGKVIFLNLWATWCGPCRVEMPGVQSLYNKMDTTGVVFIMLSIDRDTDKPKVIRYIEKNKFTFPVYQPSGFLTDQLNVPSIPTTFIISRDGKIISKEVGATNFDTAKFRKFLTGLMNR